jgi:hypothetical protein
VGTLLFKVLDARLVAGVVGVVTLLFLAQRLLFPPRPTARRRQVAGCGPDRHLRLHQLHRPRRRAADQRLS